MPLNLGLTDDEIKETVADYNGDLDFRTDEAQFGYIAESQYLILPSAGNFYKVASPVDENAKKLAVKAAADITALNVIGLGGTTDSIKYAYVRAKLVMKGYLYDFGAGINGDRKVYSNEVRVATEKDEQAVTVEIIAAIKAFLKSPERAFIDKYWRILSSIVAHVLAVRSHHFKEGVAAEQSYEALYQRLWNACAIEDRFPFADLKKLYRVAYHPFGVKAVADIFVEGVENQRLPRTLNIRIDAMPAGAAKPGTALAVINLMKAAGWFVRFQNSFSKEITVLEDAVATVKADRYKFHIARNLYGSDAPTEDEVKIFSNAEIVAKALAPYLVGYVSVECDGSPIQNQMTLRQASEDQIGLKNRFMRFLQGMAQKADRNQDIAAILPPVQAIVPVQGLDPQHVVEDVV